MFAHLGYLADDIVHTRALCICTLVYNFIAHPRSNFIYSQASLKFSTPPGAELDEKREKKGERQEEKTATRCTRAASRPKHIRTGAYFNYF